MQYSGTITTTKIILGGLFCSMPLLTMAATSIQITDGGTTYSCLQNGIEVFGDGSAKVTLADLQCLVSAEGGSSTGGDSTGGSSTGGDSTGGDSTGGDSTGGDSTGGDSTGGSSTGGDSTGGSSTGGDSTGGDQILTEAFESIADFDTGWANTYVGLGEVFSASNNTKSNLRNLIDANQDGYQVIDNNGIQKEVYIVNPSRDATTIIPACSNGKDFSFSNSLCVQSNMPFKRNEIYSLRSKTKNIGGTYAATNVTKDYGQLYLPRNETYKVSVSKYPGDVSVGTARKTDDFQGAGCTTTSSYNWFYISLKPSGTAVNYQCVVPPGSNFYVNVELENEASRAICDEGFCQFDIKTAGLQFPLASQ